MKKLMYAFILLAILSSCGKTKTAEGTLTPEEESQLVDSIAQDFDKHIQDMQAETDSTRAQVDSLLEGI
jgi:hypothetical protein